MPYPNQSGTPAPLRSSTFSAQPLQISLLSPDFQLHSLRTSFTLTFTARHPFTLDVARPNCLIPVRACEPSLTDDRFCTPVIFRHFLRTVSPVAVRTLLFAKFRARRTCYFRVSSHVSVGSHSCLRGLPSRITRLVSGASACK